MRRYGSHRISCFGTPLAIGVHKSSTRVSGILRRCSSYIVGRVTRNLWYFTQEDPKILNTINEVQFDEYVPVWYQRRRPAFSVGLFRIIPETRGTVPVRWGLVRAKLLDHDGVGENK